MAILLDRRDQPNSGPNFPQPAEITLICISTIVGTLLLALLVYTIRRKQHKSNSDSEHGRPLPAPPPVCLTPQLKRTPTSLTALPPFTEHREHAEHQDSILVHPAMRHNNPQNRQQQPATSSTSAGLLTSDKPQTQHLERSKTTTSTTSMPKPKPSLRRLRPQISMPEMAQRRPTLKSARNLLAPARTLSKTSALHMLRGLASKDGKEHEETQTEDAGLVTEFPPSRPWQIPGATRWSWTDSQAPPTPRLRMPSLPSLSHRPQGQRRVFSWVRDDDVVEQEILNGRSQENIEDDADVAEPLVPFTHVVDEVSTIGDPSPPPSPAVLVARQLSVQRLHRR